MARRSSSRPERRLHAEEGAVGADVVLVEREVVDRHAASHGQPVAPWRADDVEALARRRSGRVIAAAGELDEANVALEHDGLGRLRDAGKAQPGRDLALVHHAVLGEVGIFEYDARSARRNPWRRASTLRMTVALATLGLPLVKAMAPASLQESDLGHFLALRPLVMAAMA